MRICFLSNAQNYHTIKWATWFSRHGHEVAVISFIDAEIPGVAVYPIGSKADPDGNDINKIDYLIHGKQIKKIINDFKPDIINVHYATSYGTAMALTGVHPYILSVWGSDIYDFPNRGFLQKLMLQYSLKKADYLFSTSQAMADEAAKYTNKKFEITPFGVDVELFNPNRRNRQDNKFVIGTIKGLNFVYGIDCILKASALVLKKYPQIELEVRIAGEGKDEEKLKRLATKLSIQDQVEWLGFIDQSKVATEWANMDLALIPSIRESFGVSALEAQASGTMTITSNVQGLLEVTPLEVHKYAIIPGDYKALAKRIVYFWKHRDEKDKLAKVGMSYVKNRYEINSCFHRINELFNSIKKEKEFI